MAGKSYNNDIFKVISELDKKNYNFFNSYNESQYKELQPYTLLRWISSNINEKELIKLNKSNEKIFELSEHKNLMLNHLCSNSCGHWVKHCWIQIPKGNKVNKDIEVVKKFYGYNDDEMKIKEQSLSKEDINNVLQYLGLKDKS